MRVYNFITRVCLWFFSYLGQPPLIPELVLSRPLFRHEMVGASKDLLQLPNVQHRDRIDVVSEHEGTQVLDVVYPAIGIIFMV